VYCSTQPEVPVSAEPLACVQTSLPGDRSPRDGLARLSLLGKSPRVPYHLNRANGQTASRKSEALGKSSRSSAFLRPDGRNVVSLALPVAKDVF